MAEPPHPLLVADRVRHVGDQVAVVIAETPRPGEGRGRADRLDYEELPASSSTGDGDEAEARRRSGTRRRTTSATTGSWATRRRSTRRSPRRAHVTKLDLVNNRLIPNAMEPRAAIGEYDRATGELHALHHQPEPARHPAADGRLRAAASPSTSCASSRPMSAAASARRSIHYAEEAIVTWASRQGQAAGQMDGRAQRSLHLRRAWPRPRHPCRAGARQGRQVPRAAGRHDRQYGRLSLDLRALRPDLSLRHAAGRPVHDAGDLCRGEGGVHQHRAGRRLSRRRAAGGDLPARAARRQGGARDEDRSGGDPPANFIPRRRVPVPDAGRAAIRQRRLPDDAGRWR